MKFYEVTIATNQLSVQREFYVQQLQLPLLHETERSFTVRVGKTKLTMEQYNTATFYHLAFRATPDFFATLAPKLLDIAIVDENGEAIRYWNGRQLYFRDPAGNILELLERLSPYDATPGYIDVCEVGVPVHNVTQWTTQLAQLPNQYKGTFYDGERFKFHGDDYGVLVNVEIGRPWFPTDDPAVPSPLHVVVSGPATTTIRHDTLPYTIEVKQEWSEAQPVVQCRIARPTQSIRAVERFYGEGLQLAKVAQFTNHDGYDGVMFGLPNKEYHLEFTYHPNETSVHAPSADHLLVLYYPDEQRRNDVVARLEALGYTSVVDANPYWRDKAVTFADDEGWRVTLVYGAGL